MRDSGHEWTEEELRELEKRIAGEYSKAARELNKTVTEYFEQFTERDKAMKKLVGQEINGKVWTERDYKQWRLNQIGRGERFEKLRDEMAERYTRANEITTAYINDLTPSVYSMNRNYTTYLIDRELQELPGGASIQADWTLFDESAVRRLIVDQPDVMPYYPEARALQRGIDLAYGKEQITKNVTSHILQGMDISQLADALQRDIVTMERTSAVRAARTAVTAAQNGGRMDSIEAAEEMGIKTERTWMATLDGRTRHEHRMVDGQRRATDKPFDVDGVPMMYPGDPSAPGYLVYNCRCTVLPTPKDFDTAKLTRWSRDPNTGEREKIKYTTYEDWYKNKTGIDINNLNSSKKPSILNLKDIIVGRSLGAKAKDILVMDLGTGEEFKVAEGSHIQNVEVFAGKGVRTPYYQAYKYADSIGGNVEDWQHVKGVALLETPDGDRMAEIHWSRCEGIGNFDYFIKYWVDE